MAGFDAAPVQLQVCGSALRQIGQDVRTEMRMLQSEMDALLGAGWQGGAANGFAQCWTDWLHGAGEVLDALHDMGQLLTDTGTNYKVTDIGSADGIDASGQALS